MVRELVERRKHTHSNYSRDVHTHRKARSSAVLGAPPVIYLVRLLPRKVGRIHALQLLNERFEVLRGRAR